MSEHRFTAFEKRTIATLSTVVAMRMIGLFMILPVLALYANELTHATPYLIGLALGIYGLTQAIFQVPFGAASDRWGRRRFIVLGLIVFGIGSMVAAQSTSIFGVILGRALQGAGTVSAVVLAMVGDEIREAQRPKSMAIVGATIGSAFMLSLMLGPIVDRWVGIRGIFWLAAALAVIGIIVVWAAVPTATAVKESQPDLSTEKKGGLFERSLIVLYSGTLVLHMAITSLFLAFPIRFIEIANFDRHEMWKVIVPALLASLLVMIPLIRYSSKNNRPTAVMILASVILVIAHGVLGLASAAGTAAMLAVGLCLFFMGFNTLEALLPSATVSRAPERLRGTAMGLFNACTFIGAFLGGVFGGLVFTRYDATGLFLCAGIVILLWLAFVSCISRRTWA